MKKGTGIRRIRTEREVEREKEEGRERKGTRE